MFDREVDCLASGAALPVHAVRPDALEEWLAGLPPAQSAFLRAAGFAATAGQLMLMPGAQGVIGAALGLGTDRSPYTHAALPMALPDGTAWHLLPGDFEMDDAVLGWCLGAYQYRRLSTPKRGPAQLVVDGDRHAALAMARAAWLARDLINTPANLLGPSELADAAVAVAGRFGAETSRIENGALMDAYPAISAVGFGSDRPPVVVVFKWSGSGAAADSPLLSLCGKGVVFDTGGYDLKPSAAMLRMKKDMGGAALLLALASTVMAADLPIRMEVRIGCVENMVSGRAMRPSDVIQTRKGLSVEIGNTDAEGRLVLCDLLAEACESAPDLLVDAATLTGAARVALGPDIPAMMSNDDEAATAITAAGEERQDPVWRLPLHSGYDQWLSSSIADMGNTAGKPMAGAIVAGLFLQRFVTTPWVHIDTYAWNDSARPGRPEGGEALGLRAAFGMIRRLKRFNL
jgi:leucyl aminopeptidase